jgi:hypothetical protein
MPFNAGGQTYIGGQLLASGLGNLGQGIGGGIIQALDEQRKKQQLTDQIMLQALQTGHATPEQYLEYSKKNTKGKQDFAMTVAANFADEYKEKTKQQHDLVAQQIEAQKQQVAASKANVDYNKIIGTGQQQTQDIINQGLSWYPTKEDEERAARAGGEFVWTPKGFDFQQRTGTSGKAISPYAHTPQWSQDGKRIVGYYNESGSLEYLPGEELKTQKGEGSTDIKTMGIPNPQGGGYLKNKVMVVGPGEAHQIIDMPVDVEGSPFKVDPETNILIYKDTGKAVEGSAVQAAQIWGRFLGGGGGGGGAQAGDAGSGVSSTYGWLKDLLWGPGGAGAQPTPTATPTAAPSPIDQIIQQISPTPSPTATAAPAETPSPSPTGTPLDAIINQITAATDQPATAAALSGAVGAPPAEQLYRQLFNQQATPGTPGGALDQIIKKIAASAQKGAAKKGGGRAAAIKYLREHGLPEDEENIKYYLKNVGE